MWWTYEEERHGRFIDLFIVLGVFGIFQFTGKGLLKNGNPTVHLPTN
jgi:hypothetical protein